MNPTVAPESPAVSKPPVSARKAAANRANAKRSTGPRTPAGKAASSLNALRHGILARSAFNFTIEGKKRRTEFEAIVAGLAQEFQPRTMSEHMTVQQLAGCYWRLAKVWAFETESAWRNKIASVMPMEEFQAYDKSGYRWVVDRITERQNELFPRAGLGKPTIPAGPSASTILRYQGAINTMLFRCLGMLERRRKEQVDAGETSEQLDYTNEPAAAAPTPPKPEVAASRPETPAAAASAEKPIEPAKKAELHKRSQKDEAGAALSSNEEAKNTIETPAPDAVDGRNRDGTA